MIFSPPFVMLNLFQHNERRCVILKQVQDDDGFEFPQCDARDFQDGCGLELVQ